MRTTVPFAYGRDPLCLGSLLLYVTNRELIKPNLRHYSPFFHGHLNDCLLVPVALPFYLWVYRRLGLRASDAPPRAGEIVFHVIVWAWFFEWLGPHQLHVSTGDPLDVLCYAGGGLVACFVWAAVYARRGADAQPPLAS